MNSTALSPLRIRSGQGDYTVDFLGSVAEAAERALALPSAMIVCDRRVAKLYEKQLAPIFASVPALLIDATEDEKTLAGVGRLSDWLQSRGAGKQTTLIAIGGGIVQDIVTFTAHIYYRGIRWVFVPTTLLSMDDSCIGAKCGINLNAYKNQLGVFQSPSQVWVCPAFTETLPDFDMASGYGEMLKLMLTGSEADYEAFKAAWSRDGMRGPELPGLIARSLEIKKAVIEADEYEKDLRRTLNYGHTFGHSLEAITRHAVPHGYAVAWGLDLVNFLAVRRGLLDARWFDDIHGFVAERLPFQLGADVAAEQLVDGAKRDKKVEGASVNLAVMEKPGTLKIVKTPLDSRLTADIADYLENHDVFRRN